MELQIDILCDACIDALGTYLLPVFHKHAGAHMDLLSSLPGPTLARVLVATARCSNCVSRAGNAPMCAPTCKGRRSLVSYRQQAVHPVSVGSDAVCAVCSFKPSHGAPNTGTTRMAITCTYCNSVRSWV